MLGRAFFGSNSLVTHKVPSRSTKGSLFSCITQVLLYSGIINPNQVKHFILYLSNFGYNFQQIGRHGVPAQYLLISRARTFFTFCLLTTESEPTNLYFTEKVLPPAEPIFHITNIIHNIISLPSAASHEASGQEKKNTRGLSFLELHDF